MNSAEIAVFSFLEVAVSVYSIKYLFFYWRERYWPVKNSDSETCFYLSLEILKCHEACDVQEGFLKSPK